MVALKYFKFYSLVLLCGGLLASVNVNSVAAQQRLSMKLFASVKDGADKPVAAAKVLNRKHFYLIAAPAKLDREKTFTEMVTAVGVPPSLKSYQTALVEKGKLTDAQAQELIQQWLLKYNCESVYCRDITPDDLLAIEVFREAHKASARFFNVKPEEPSERSLHWLPNFLPEIVRTGYYDARRAWTTAAIAYLEKNKGVTVTKGMTSQQGVTYFANLLPGVYYVSNLAPIEVCPPPVANAATLTTSQLWFAEITDFDAVKLSKQSWVDVKKFSASAAPNFQCK